MVVVVVDVCRERGMFLSDDDGVAIEMLAVVRSSRVKFKREVQ